MSKSKKEQVSVGTLQPKSIFTYGGVNWLVLDKKGDGVICLAEKVLLNKAFDECNYNNWADSSLRKYLNNDFLEKLTCKGASKTDLLTMTIDLTADEGLKDYGTCEDTISLISCQQYRKYRGIITNADDWWWTCTAYSTKANGYSCYVLSVYSDGTLDYKSAYRGEGGVRPLLTLQSSVLVSIERRTSNGTHN